MALRTLLNVSRRNEALYTFAPTNLTPYTALTPLKEDASKAKSDMVVLNRSRSAEDERMTVELELAFSVDLVPVPRKDRPATEKVNPVTLYVPAGIKMIPPVVAALMAF